MNVTLSFLVVLSAFCEGADWMVLPRVDPGRPVHSAFEAFRSGSTCEALDLARPAATRGDGDALFLLGFAAEQAASKSGRNPSYARAAEFYYERASDAGNPNSRWRRLLLTMTGGDSESASEARRNLESATANGKPEACRILGEAWMRGLIDGVADSAKASELWRKAVELGDADSLVPLGACLLTSGTEVGDEFLERAAQSGNAEAWLILGDHYEQVMKNHESAMRHFRRGAEAGQPTCMFRVATRLAGNGTDSDDDEARRWLKRAADAGFPPANARMGMELLPVDPERAYGHLLHAANEHIVEAQHQIALLHLDGHLGARDPVAACAWLLRGAKSSDAEIQFKLASLHEEGIGTPINYANAGILYTLACNQGHAEAAARIARMAAEGLGTEHNPIQAWAYASLAVQRGDKSAMGLLERMAKKLEPSELDEAKSELAKLGRSEGNPESSRPR